MKNKLAGSKIGKGLVRFIIIMVMLISVLALSVYYKSGITANAVNGIASGSNQESIPVREINGMDELSQLNEGWYEIRSGFVYYLEYFNSYIPLYMHVNDEKLRNGLFSVDGEGNIEFREKDELIGNKEIVDEEEKISQNQISGEVTGMEKVSGFVTSEEFVWMDDKRAQQKSGRAPVGVPTYDHYFTRGSYQIWESIKPEGNIVRYKKSSDTSWTNGVPPDAASNKHYEVKINDKWYAIPNNYDNLQKAQEAMKGVGTVREAPVQTATGDKYHVFDAGNNYIGTITAKPGDAQIQGEILAKVLNKEYGYIDQPKFKLSSPQTGTKIYDAPNMEDAKAQFRKEWRTDPQSSEELKPGTTITGNTYFIIDKTTGQKIATLNDVPSEEKANEVLGNYQGNDLYKGRSLELKKAPTLEDLKKQNPNVPVHILQKELENYVAPKDATAQNLVQPTLTTLDVFGKKVYYVNNQRYEKESDALEAFSKANLAYQKAAAETFAKEQLKGKTLTGEITPDGELIAKDSQGVYKLITTKDANDKITGGRVEKVGDTYKTLEIVGDIRVETTKESTTGKKLEIVIKKEGKSATVDEETLKQIKDAKGKGFKIEITQEGASREGLIPTRDFIAWCDADITCKTDSLNVQVKSYQDAYREATGNDPLVAVSSKDQKKIEIRDKDNQLVEQISFSPDYTPEKGTKTDERYKTAYFYNGKEISQAEAEQLRKDGKGQEVTEKNEFLISKITVETENNKIKSVTRFYFRTVYDEKGSPTRIYEAIKYDEKDNPVTYTYGKDGKEITFDASSFKGPFGLGTACKPTGGDSSLSAEACTAFKQYGSRQFFAEVERIFTEFSGLGYYSTLFFDEDSLLEWRDNVDRAFATFYLGTEYWTSAICSNYLDGENDGIAYAETPQGLAQVGAHVEATRTEPIRNVNGTEFIYKITFNVRNGDFDKDPRAPEKMKINLVIKGDKTVKIFKKDIEIKRGSSFGRTGRGAIVQSSKSLFSQICITFDQLPLRWKLDNNELCNTIVQSSGVPTPIGSSTASTSTAGTDSTGEINDF